MPFNRTLAPLLLASSLVLAACGGSPSTSAGRESPPVATASTAAEQAGKNTHGHGDADEHEHDGEHGAGDEHGHEHGDAHGEGEPDFARLDPATAGTHGIVVATAAGGAVAETITLTGRLIIDPTRIASVRARFPGPVVRVHKEVGETLRQGDALADVESNESLTVYAVRAPLAGVVLERMTNVGDVAGTEPLFRVGDTRALQAELKVFPSQRAALAVGADARVRAGDAELTGRVVAIAPQVEGHTQALNVRVALQLPPTSTLVPGEFVTALVEHGRGDAAVVVPSDAVQRLDGRDVVFVPETEGFRAVPVTVGRRGASHVEIRTGFSGGAQYVAKGAFLLKAEIGKNEAAHEH